MKKLTAILLMVLFLFNMIGYRLLIGHWQQESDQELVAQLDKGNYNESALIEIKVPLQLNYPRDMPAFERADGEIAVGGTFYRYVKMKWYNDTLSLLCVNNTEKASLQARQHDYFQHTSDLPGTSGKKQAAFKSIVTDYFFEELNRESPVQEQASSIYSSFASCFSHSLFIRAVEQPPEVVA